MDEINAASLSIHLQRLVCMQGYSHSLARVKAIRVLYHCVLNAKMEAERGYKHVLAGDDGKKPRGEI